MKIYIYAIILFFVFSLFIFIEITKAATPPAGCTCPGPGGTCVGGGSSWVSPTRYQGYYYCKFTDTGCPALIQGWKIISRTLELLDTHGCDSPACTGGGCAVTGALWDKIPPPTCTLIATPSSIGGTITSSTLSWSTTNITFPLDTVAISNGADYNYTATSASGSTTVAPTSTATYTMTINNGMSATCSATVTVVPLSCTISASPTGVFSGDTTNINWTVTSATGGTITDGAISTTLTAAQIAAGSGSFTTSPITGPKTYSMTVSGIGTASCGPAIIGIITPPIGGLIPCGRLGDNPDTDDINEHEPCNLCAMFYMLKNVLNFVMTLAIGIGVFILVIAGLLYALSAGNPRNIELAKSAVTSMLIGLALVFIAWMVIAVILQGMGYANIASWNQVKCM